MAQIPCEGISLQRFDTSRQITAMLQDTDTPDDLGIPEDWNRVFWTHYWDCQALQLPASHRRPAERRQDL